MIYGFQHKPEIMIEDLLIFLPKHFSGIRFEPVLRDTEPMDFRWFRGATSIVKSVQPDFLIEAFLREIIVKISDPFVKTNPNFRSFPILRECGWLEEVLEDFDVANIDSKAKVERFKFQEYYRRFSDSSSDTAPVKALVSMCSKVDERKFSGSGPGYEHEESQFHEIFHRMNGPNGAVCEIAVRNMTQEEYSGIEEAAMMFKFQGTFAEIKDQRAFFETQMGKKFSQLHAPYAYHDFSGEESGLIQPWDGIGSH